MNVGFIGLGAMGRPMMANLVKKGFSVVAYDIVPAALDAGVKLGAKAASSAANATTGADVVVTIVPSASNVEAVYLGDGGVLAGVRAGSSASTCRRSIQRRRARSPRHSVRAARASSTPPCRAAWRARRMARWRS